MSHGSSLVMLSGVQEILGMCRARGDGYEFACQRVKRLVSRCGDQFSRAPLYLVFNLHRTLVEGLSYRAEIRRPFETGPFLFRYISMKRDSFLDTEA